MRRTTAFYLLVSMLLVLIRGCKTEISGSRFDSRKLPSRGITGSSFDVREIRDMKRLGDDTDKTRRLADRRITDVRRNRLDERLDIRMTDTERRYISRESRELRIMQDVSSYESNKRVTEFRKHASRYASDERKNKSRKQPQNQRLENVGKIDGLNMVGRSVSGKTLPNERRRDANDEVRSMPSSRTREMFERREIVRDDTGKIGRSQPVLSHRRKERNDRLESNRNDRRERMDSKRLEDARFVSNERKITLTSRMRSLPRRESRRRIAEYDRRDLRRQRRINKGHEDRKTDEERKFRKSDNVLYLDKRFSASMQERRQETSGRIDKSLGSRRMDNVDVRMRNTPYSPRKRDAIASQLSRIERNFEVRGTRISGQEINMSLDPKRLRNQRRNENIDNNRRQPIETRLESNRSRITRSDSNYNVNRTDKLTTVSKVQKPSEKQTENIARINRGTDGATYNKSHTRRISTSNLHPLTIDYRFFQIQKIYHRDGKTEKYEDQSRREDTSRRRLNRHDLLDTKRRISAVPDRRSDRYVREDRRRVQHVLNKNRCAYRQPAREFQRRYAITERVSRDESRFSEAAYGSQIDRKLEKRLSTSFDRLAMPVSYKKPESTIQSWFSSQYLTIDDWSVTRALVVGFVGMMGRSFWQKQP